MGRPHCLSSGHQVPRVCPASLCCGSEFHSRTLTPGSGFHTALQTQRVAPMTPPPPTTPLSDARISRLTPQRHLKRLLLPPPSYSSWDTFPPNSPPRLHSHQHCPPGLPMPTALMPALPTCLDPALLNSPGFISWSVRATAQMITPPVTASTEICQWLHRTKCFRLFCEAFPSVT